MRHLSEMVATGPTKPHKTTPSLLRRMVHKYGKLCFVVLCVISVVLEGFTLTMMSSNSRENDRAVTTVRKVIESAKRMLGSMLHEPRMLPVNDQSHPLDSGTLPSWMSDTAPRGQPTGYRDPVPQPAPVSGWVENGDSIPVPMHKTSTDTSTLMRDPLLTPDHTLCLRARSFKIAYSQVTVTTCLFRGRPMVDIRRWEHGVLVPRLKPVVLSPREYFGLSRQYGNIAARITSLQTRIRFPIRDDTLVVEVDNGSSKVNASIAESAKPHPPHEGVEHD